MNKLRGHHSPALVSPYSPDFLPCATENALPPTSENPGKKMKVECEAGGVLFTISLPEKNPFLPDCNPGNPLQPPPTISSLLNT